ncbi:MAG: hypothetical protein JW974_00645, partial [Alphaproteobacteria bacterium]|nr:hypothetical protein [Alphaproteobacteria bacterium]MBN2675257.1 hypothetical protein [Alphaproteobacteria bacterium]
GCDWQTTAGTYVATANATTATTCTAGYYCPSALIAYGSTGTITACPTNYTSGGTGLSVIGSCKWQTTAGTYIATANATTATTCTAGYYCPSALISYGSTGSIIQCTGATYSAAGATSCTSCPTGYTYNTTDGKTASTQCEISCATGTRVDSRYASSCTSPSGSWYTTASDVISYGTISPVNYCMKDFTSASTSASGHDSMTDCSASVSAGAYIPSATIQARYVRIASNGSTANTGNHVAEVQAFTASNATGTNLLSGVSAGTGTNLASATDGNWARSPYASCTSISGCIWDMGSVNTLGSLKFALYTDGRTYYDVGVYVSIDGNTWTQVFGTVNLPTQSATTAVGEVIVLSSPESSCAAGTAKLAHTVIQGQTSSCDACTGATYSSIGAPSCTACPTNYDDNTESYKTAATQCQFQTTTGYYIPTANATSATTCAAGSYCPAALVNYGSTGNIISCPTNYDDGGTMAGTINECQLQTTGGTYIKFSNDTTETICTAGYYCPSTLVNYGSTGTRTACPTNYDDGGTGLSEQNQCKWQTLAGTYVSTAYATSAPQCIGGYYCPSVLLAYGDTGSIIACSSLPGVNPSGGTYTSSTGSGGSISCKYTAPNKTITGCSYVNSIQVTYTGSAWPASTYSVNASGGYVIANNNTATATCNICSGPTYSAGGIATSCTSCPTNYVDDTSDGKTTNTQCKWQTTAGTYIATANDTTLTSCMPGYYCPSALISYGSTGYTDGCLPGTYSDAGASECTDCAIGSYSDDASDFCYACQNGTTTTTTGQTSCNAVCSNNNSYDSSWATATWNNNIVSNLCLINGCMGGYYTPVNTCSEVGVGYWSANNSITRTACSAGLTTIGFGVGADEAGDCGRILNFGAERIYMRSNKKTTPSLNINVGGTVYYGNMTTDTKGSLRINSSGTQYSVYDDSM